MDSQWRSVQARWKPMEDTLSTATDRGSYGSSIGSGARKLSIHPSVTWGGHESDSDTTKSVTPPEGPIKQTIRLPGLLSKAGRLCSSHKQLMRTDYYDEARSKQVEDQINYDHLQKLERMFHEADIDGGGGLDMEEFRKAMKKIMGGISDEDVDVIFMKVDTNCDGSVDWEEYLNYMLSEYRGKADMLKNESALEFQITMKPVPVAHSEEIVKIQFFPNQRGMFERHRPRRGGPPGRFLTVSRDGILHYWSDSFKMLRTVYLDQTKRRQSFKLWVIDMLCLSNINLMAIASTDQDIEFFDIGGNKCDLLFALVDLEGCATAMDYWTDGRKGVFCVGDMKGNVMIFTSTDVVMKGLFNVRSYIGGLARVPVQILLKGKSETYRNFSISALHGDWCQQISYIPQLNLVASCASSEKTAMALTSLPLHNIGKTQSAVIVLKKGILCFDYASEINILVTGGIEPQIQVWNPYVTSSPITQMKGHATAVTHIMVNRRRETIVSISKDKNIRVWDLLDHYCMQSIHGRNVPLGNFPISAAYYHRPSNFLICSTYTIGLFFGAEALEQDTKSHEQPLCCVLYNKNFKQAVSGSYSGSICVWDILTGQKLMEFSTSRGNPVEITAMVFDTPQRRLITTLKNGFIKLWNFNNGVCLKELPATDKSEISCITYVDKKIFISGWSRRVTWFQDSKDENKVIESKHWKSYHSEDILCMDSHSNKVLATASCNGDIVLWNIYSGQAFCRFNAWESPLVLRPKREFSVDSDSDGIGLPKKTAVFHARGRRCLACGLSGKPHLHFRPASAHVPGVSSHRCPKHRHVHENECRVAHAKAEGVWKEPSPGPHKSDRWPASEVPVIDPSVAEPGGTKKSAWGSVGSVGSDHVPLSKTELKKPIPSWQEEIGASQMAVENVTFLNTRERDPQTAILLSSCSDGFIYAWAVGNKGGMMGKFRGAHGTAREIAISTMSTDDKDLVLFTGDSLGYIKIWDIMDYCRRAEPKGSMTGKSSHTLVGNVFRDLIPDYCRYLAKSATKEATESIHNGWVTTLVPPTCLSSWKGHLKKVVSVCYVERFKAVLTASHDCTVKLWLLTGRHVGTFGESLWRMEMQQLMTPEVPDELRRIASLHTLKVLNEGRRPHWESTRSIIQTLSQEKRQESLLMDFLHVKSSTDATAKMHDFFHKETRIAQYTEDQVEDTFKKWEESGKKRSKILGYAYKQKIQRPMLKQLPEMKANVSNREQTRIYHCIQYTELHALAAPHIPESLKEAQLNQIMVEQRTSKKLRKWHTVSGLMRPTLRSYMRRKHTEHTKE